MATFRETPEDAAMRYHPPYAAPRKAGRPKNNKRMKSPLEEKKKRKSTGSKSEAMVDDNEGEEEEEEEGDTAPARNPKRARSWSQLIMFFLVMLINNIHWYLVMQMNWHFFGDVN
jgi:hypothetical protein